VEHLIRLDVDFFRKRVNAKIGEHVNSSDSKLPRLADFTSLTINLRLHGKELNLTFTSPDLSR